MKNRHASPAPQLREQRQSDKASPPTPDNPDAWFTPGKFALIFGVLVVACFPQVVFGFETFFFRDFGAFSYPVAFYQRECFWRGELPLWNPLSYCGVPFLAQWNTAALYPPSLFYLIFPLSWSLGVFCLAHLLFAGLGMYFLAYRWTGNRLAASVAGTVFGFNGLMWYMLMWTSNIAAEAWMPWVVLAVERAWQTGGRRNLILAAFAGAMQMLTGSPEGIVLTWIFLLGLWLVQLFQRSQSRSALLWRLLAVAGLIAALAAAQLLPFMDLLAHSQRSAAFGKSLWSMPRSGWANYLVPLFHYFRSMQGTYSPHDQYWAASYYLGTATIALALLALWRVRDARTWVLAGLTGLCLVLALGDAGVLYAGLRQLAPMLGFMRYPIKFVMLPTFLVPLLAARALAWCQALPDGQWITQRRKLGWLAALLVLAIAAIVSWSAHHPAVMENPVVTLENALVRVAFLVAIVGCLFIIRQVQEYKLQVLLRVSLLFLLWFDVFTHAPQFHPTVARAAYQPDLIRQFFSESSKWGSSELQPGESRAMRSVSSVMQMNQSWIDDPAVEVNGRRLAQFPDYNLLDHVAVFDGFFSLELHYYAVIESWLIFRKETNNLPRLYEFLGVSQTTEETNTVQWVPVEKHLPIITAGQEPVFLRDHDALGMLGSDEFDPAHKVYLPPDAESTLTARRANAKILSHQFSDQHVEAEVETDSPAMVVIAQTFYHPWRAYVDDHPTRLWRANFAFQSMEVPAGRHKVRLVYEDRAFNIGAAISLGTLALCVVGWFVKRKSGQGSPSPT